MAVLGIDYGSKRIGLARAEDGSAVRWQTLANDDAFWPTLKALIKDTGIDTVAVGLPRNLDGNDTVQTAVARQFADSLHGQLPHLTVVLQDEADTSNQARYRLQAEGVASAKVDSLVDAEAAAIILEDYLRD